LDRGVSRDLVALGHVEEGGVEEDTHSLIGDNGVNGELEVKSHVLVDGKHTVGGQNVALKL
jgi:hypothetical protein